MCLACQMEDELWFAYLDHVAEQKKAAAQIEYGDACWTVLTVGRRHEREQRCSFA